MVIGQCTELFLVGKKCSMVSNKYSIGVMGVDVNVWNERDRKRDRIACAKIPRNRYFFKPVPLPLKRRSLRTWKGEAIALRKDTSNGNFI